MHILLHRLQEEKVLLPPTGLYHELQILLSYHSNRIEGGRLTESQVRSIYETRTVADNSGIGINVDDILEVVNHFRAFDYIIDTATEAITEEDIKELHRMLEQGTRDSSFSWFAVGDYKKMANTVAERETSKPEDVARHMKELIRQYEDKQNVTIEDIVTFHYRFECIHPFQDGNGRVGRLIAFKECLRHAIIPFIIEDEKKHFYYQGLARWTQEKGYLIETCLDGQDTMVRLLKSAGIDGDLQLG